MKTKIKSVSLVVAAALAGAALFAVSKTSFSAFFPGDLAIAIVTAAAVVGFALRDYSRRVPGLSAHAVIVRPAIRVRDQATPKTTAYGVKPVRSERLAA